MIRRSPQDKTSVNVRMGILEVVHNALSRPEFECASDLDRKVGTIHVRRGDFRYRVSVVVYPVKAVLYVHNVVNGQPDIYGKAFFIESFFLKKMGKVRQKALILAKKIVHREVYEVMSM